MSAIEKRFSDVKRSATFRRIVQHFRLHEKSVLDIGCGFGEYLAHFGKGSRGITTTPEEVRAGAERGLSIVLANAEDIEAMEGSYEAFWINNLFEHLLAPHAFLVKLKRVAREDSLVILGVPVVPGIPALMRAQRFRGALASNHINFFTRRTLALTVERAGWEVVTCRSFFFSSPWLDRLTLPLAPHVYVVAKNNPAFRYPEKKKKEWEGDARYRALVALAESDLQASAHRVA